MKFRIKDTQEILVPRMTDNGTIILLPEGDQQHYIDDYFHDNKPVPELEFSVVDGEWIPFEYIKEWGTQG